MSSPWLSLGQLNISREGAVNWDADIITLSVGPCRETTTSQQCSETNRKGLDCENASTRCGFQQEQEQTSSLIHLFASYE